MRIVIFGANGQTGRLATRRALDAGYTTVAVTRTPGDFPFSDPALTVAGADVHDVDAVGAVVADADAVLSTLGVTFTRESVNTYSRGTTNIVAAMQSSRASRLPVIISTRPTATRDDALDGLVKQRRLRNPRSSRFATSLEPMKPVAPVTRIRSSCPTIESCGVISAISLQLIGNQLTSNRFDANESHETC